jgi:hypothetical protein
MCLPIGQKDAFAPPVYVCRLHLSLHFDHVGFGDGTSWMQKSLRELAIVRREEHSARIEIQSAHREHTPRGTGQKLSHGRASFGITHRRDNAARLVQNQVDERRSLPLDALAVDLDVADPRVDFGPELGNQPTVHAHPPAGNEGLGHSAGRNPGARENLLQAHR